MWGRWFAGAVLVGIVVLGGCERSEEEDIHGIGGAPGSGRPAEPAQQSAEPADKPEENVRDGEMIRDGGRMIRPGEE